MPIRAFGVAAYVSLSSPLSKTCRLVREDNVVAVQFMIGPLRLITSTTDLHTMKSTFDWSLLL